VRDEVVPTPREMEILKVLWELGEATVRDVYRKLRAHGGGGVQHGADHAAHHGRQRAGTAPRS